MSHCTVLSTHTKAVYAYNSCVEVCKLPIALLTLLFIPVLMQQAPVCAAIWQSLTLAASIAIELCLQALIMDFALKPHLAVLV